MQFWCLHHARFWEEYITIVAGQTGMLAVKSIPATIIFYYIFVYICDIQIITPKSKKILFSKRGSFMMASKIVISASDDYKNHP